jgi:ketosteroid isomerase-like protein
MDAGDQVLVINEFGGRGRSPRGRRPLGVALGRKPTIPRDTAWAMSRDPEEILRRLGDALNRGEVDDALRYMDADIELRAGVVAPDQDTFFRGHQGIRDFWDGATDAWESVEITREEVITAPDNRFLVVDRWFFHGREGIEIERELPTLFTFRDGLIVRIDGFTDKAEAFEAAGLSE